MRLYTDILLTLWSGFIMHMFSAGLFLFSLFSDLDYGNFTDTLRLKE
ncbi:hypothetical protein N9772_00355 [Bacteroidia bacterium]|nr:hypothetical protein [Bacteroidia bacterium]